MFFEAFLCSDETLIAVFHNQDFNDTITINQSPQNHLEYSWDVYIDVDANANTGSPGNFLVGIPGFDYDLSLARWSNGTKKIVPITDIEAFQINVWKLDAKGGGSAFSNATWYANAADKIIILKGVIPGINMNSRIVLSRFYLTKDNNLTYVTDYATTKTIP